MPPHVRPHKMPCSINRGFTGRFAVARRKTVEEIDAQIEGLRDRLKVLEVERRLAVVRALQAEKREREGGMQ